MRFHLTMFFVTVAVSLGMHAMAQAAEPPSLDDVPRICLAATPAGTAIH